MRCLIIPVVAATVLLPSIVFADKKPVRDGRRHSPGTLPVSQYGEIKPCQACSRGSIYPEWMAPPPTLSHPGGYGAFGDELRHQLLWDQHECAPDGCIKPVGCSNLWTEIKFIFGSCRQFFGTAESTVGHHRNTRDRFSTPLR